MKRFVKDLLKSNPGAFGFAQVSPETSIAETLELMVTQNCSSALVTKFGRLVGIFSEKDFVRVFVQQKGSLDTNLPVRGVMTVNVYYATPDYTVEQCLSVMARKNIRHLPILELHSPIAFLSLAEMSRVLVEERDEMIDDLIHYITGSHSGEHYFTFPLDVTIRTIESELEVS
jgi:CBS domain-containing protein